MKETLKNDLMEAMRQKDTVTKNTIQSIRAAILQEEKDKQKEMTDDDIMNIIVKEKKKRQDAYEQFQKAGREDLVMQTHREIQILEGYLPEQLSYEEIVDAVQEIISNEGATSMKDMGKVMKVAKEQLGNRVDGKELSDIVKQELGGLQ